MQAITIIFQLLPAIIAAMKAIEEAIPGAGQGEAKLAAVRQMIEAVDTSIGKMWPQIASVVAVLVTLFNSTGAFGKK